MECILHWRVDHRNISMMLKAQNIALVQKLKGISNSHVVFSEIEMYGKKGLKLDHMDFMRDSEAETHGSSTDLCASNTPSLRSHQTLNM